MKMCMYTFFSRRVYCLVIIFVNPFTPCVTDRYQHKHCIIMETETEENMEIWMFREFIGCVCNMML